MDKKPIIKEIYGGRAWGIWIEPKDGSYNGTMCNIITNKEEAIDVARVWDQSFRHTTHEVIEILDRDHILLKQ